MIHANFPILGSLTQENCLNKPGKHNEMLSKTETSRVGLKIKHGDQCIHKTCMYLRSIS